MSLGRNTRSSSEVIDPARWGHVEITVHKAAQKSHVARSGDINGARVQTGTITKRLMMKSSGNHSNEGPHSEWS